VLLIISGKLERTASNSKWFKAIDRSGATVRHWAVGAAKLPAWLQQRARSLGLRIDPDALTLLAERVEGNLLAAAQELEKLRLLSSDDHITLESITGGVMDNARYTLFGMLDSALAGNSTEALRMLQGLHSEGTEAAVILWALARELGQLQQLCEDCASGQAPARVMQQHKVWQSRMAAVGAALKRHNPNTVGALYQFTMKADAAAKGYGPGDPWLLLEQAVLALSTEGEGWFTATA
jgi:DNA polymerase-3 subunit delta